MAIKEFTGELDAVQSPTLVDFTGELDPVAAAPEPPAPEAPINLDLVHSPSFESIKSQAPTNLGSLAKRTTARVLGAVPTLTRAIADSRIAQIDAQEKAGVTTKAGAFVDKLIPRALSAIATPLENKAKQWEKEAVDALDPEWRAATEKQFVERDTEGHLALGAGLKDPKAIAAQLIDVAGLMAPGVAASSLAARATYGARFTAALAEAAAKKVPQSVAIDFARQSAQKSALAAAAAAGSLSEGVLAGGQQTQQVEDTINALDEETMMNYGPYRELRDEGIDHEAARAQVARNRGLAAGIASAAITGLTGAPLNRFIGKLAAGLPTVTSRLGRAAEGAALEGGQEVIQEGADQLGSNLAEQPITGKGTWDGVIESALTGGIFGAVLGGAGGISAPHVQADEKAGDKTLDQLAKDEESQRVQTAAGQQIETYQQTKRAYETAQAAAADPSVRVDHASVQEAKQAYQQATVDLGAAALNSGALKPEQQKAVAQALQQAQEAGIETTVTAPAPEVRLDTKPNAVLSEHETTRLDHLDRIANSDQIEHADLTSLAAEGLAKTIPGGKAILTPEGRRQRKSLQSRLDTIEAQEAAAKEKAKAPALTKNSQTAKRPTRTAPTAGGMARVAARKPVSVKVEKPKAPRTLKLPAERRAAVRAQLATKVEKVVATEQREKQRAKNAQKVRDADFAKAKNQVADQTIATAEYTQAPAGAPLGDALAAATPAKIQAPKQPTKAGLAAQFGRDMQRITEETLADQTPADSTANPADYHGQLWNALQKGDTNHGGTANKILKLAQPAFQAGKIKTREDFNKFLKFHNDVLKARKDLVSEKGTTVAKTATVQKGKPTVARSAQELSLEEAPAFNRYAATETKAAPAKPIGSFKAPAGRPHTATLYRGVPKGANATQTQRTLGHALFYAQKSDVAERYAGKDGTVAKHPVTFSNLLEADTLPKLRDSLGLGATADLPEIIERARDLGYDGLKYDLKPDVEYIKIPGAPSVSGEHLQKIVTQVQQEFGVKVKIALTPKDLPKFQGDSVLQSETEGVFMRYPDGSTEIWLVQANLKDEAAARRVAIHEIVGHDGLRALLGEDYAKTMQAIRRSFPAEVRSMAARSGYPWIAKAGPLQEKFRNLAAEEIVAYASERVLLGNAPKQSIWARIVARVRTALRNVGWLKGISAQDINDLILRARDAVVARGKTQAKYEAAFETARRTGDTALTGMPTKARIPGVGEVTVGPFLPARDAAADYRLRSGIGTPEPRVYAKVDPKFAARIAQAFEKMPHAPNDPKVKAAYDAMISETLAQYQAIKATGLKVEFITGKDPYAASPRLAVEDVKNNNHLWVFPTESGFGAGEVQDSPMLQPTEEELGGRILLANDVFRIVHDYFGHVQEGNGFRADGEENAWRIHASMYSPQARAAMTTETRGQNSWLNFGPHGEKNQTAKSEDTVYAAQKVGLLPEEFWEDPSAEILRRVKQEQATVNIGLATPDGKGITAEEARIALRGAGVRILKDSIQQSDTEETLVAKIHRALTPDEAHALAVTLRQDAIAQTTGKGGELYGPQAEAWRPFNPAFFMDLDGRRLSEKPLSAARQEAQNIIRGIGKYLTPAEKEGLNRTTAQGLVDLFKELPTGKDLAAAAIAGQAKRGWYKQSAKALVNVFGPDAPRFAALLAALSPQTSVEGNLTNAVRVWRGWLAAGRPTDPETIQQVMSDNVQKNAGTGVLPAWVPNSIRALTSEDPEHLTLSGPKVDSFAANLRDETNAITLDTWMANFANVDQTIFAGARRGGVGGKSKGYLAFSARVRQAAEHLTELTGETWTPAEVQETVWSWTKATYEEASSMGALATARDLIENKEISDALINATPDFATLLQDPKYAAVLREAGYGDALDRAYAAANASKPEGQKIAPLEGDDKRLLKAAGRLDALRKRRAAESADFRLAEEDDPLRLDAEDDIEVARSVYRPTGDPDVDSLMAKIGSPSRTLKQMWQDWTQELGDRALQGAFDDLHGIKRAETLSGISTADQGYANARLSRSSAELTQAIVEYGPPVWDGGAANVKPGVGLMQILKPLGANVDLFMVHMVAKRANRLAGEGRENLFAANEIAAGLKLAKTHPEFVVAAQQFAALNAQVLDFAEEAGIIDPDTRALWENADYIPFYRIVENGSVGQSTNAGALGKVRNQIKQLRGGKTNIGDPLENIVRNWLALTDASLKAQATRTVVDNLDGTGFVKKVPNVEVTQAIVPLSEVKKFLKTNPALAQSLQSIGVNPANLPANAFKGMQKMMAVQAPAGDDIVTVWRDGKREYWRATDDLLMESLLSISSKAWGPWMEFFRYPKRLLTATVTTTPQFALKNLWRDMWHAYVQGTSDGKTILPGVDTIKGTISTIKMSDDAKGLLAGGGSMTHGYIRGGDTTGSAASIRSSLRKAKATTYVANTPAKLWHLYRDLLNASENAHRVSVYNRAAASGRSRKEALLEARDLLDFSMRGNNLLVRFLVESVPFFNARLQGLYRLGRGAAENPVPILLRGMLMAAASVALLARNWDDDRYKELSKDQKNTYWHIFDVFTKGDHIKIPKPFEVGTVFGTVPEAIGDALLTNAEDPDAAKQSLELMGHALGQVLNLSPQLQTVQPILELAINKDSFTGAPILTQGDEGKLPAQQDGPAVNPSYRWLAQAMPDVAPEALRSPKQLQHLGRGYVGNIQDYVLLVTDKIASQAAGDPAAPEKFWYDWPGLRDFYGKAPSRHTKYMDAMFEISDKADKIYNSLQAVQEDDAQVEHLENKYAPYLDVRQDFEKAKKSVIDMRKEQRTIQLDPDMTPAEKRQEMDSLQQDINDTAKDVWPLRPGGALNLADSAALLGAPHTDQVAILKRNGLTATAELLNGMK